MIAARLAPTPMLLHCRLCERLLAATYKPDSGVSMCVCVATVLCSADLLSATQVWYRFSSLILSGLPSGINFRSADLISASVVTMSTVVPTKVSAAETKLQQKVTEQRQREAAKLLETRAKDAAKVVTKVQATKLSLDSMCARADFGTLPDSVRAQLLALCAKLESIHELGTNIMQSDGMEEGEMPSMQDTIHT
jgi:ribosome-binding factor A